MKRIPATHLIKHFIRQYFENCIKIAVSAADFDIWHIEARTRCQIYRDIPYRPTGAAHHLLDIYRPKESGRPLPVLMYIHGGGFTICSKDTHRSVALAYADQGHVVFNVNYRLAPEHRFPAALEDVCHAYRWIVENAEAYGGDLTRLSMAGESAGANLVLALTIACCYRRKEPMAERVWDTCITPKAVQILCGLMQVSEPERLRYTTPKINPAWAAFQLKIVRDIAADYFGTPSPAFRSDCELADPLKIMESASVPFRPLPAVFAMAGTSDILLDDTRRLEKALRRKKTTFMVRYYPNEEHAFHLLYWKKNAKLFWADSFDFLDQHV